MNNKTQKIAALNDQFRNTLFGGRVIITAGISSLPPHTQTLILQAVQSFKTFTSDNDPYGEHDFGSINLQEQAIFWKIDYYDNALEYASPDPSDPAVTTRVLTIMLAEEY